MRRTAEEIKSTLEKHGYFSVRLLGQGSFSDVYLIKNCEGSFYACKVSENSELLYREGIVMEKLRHPLFPEKVEYWQEQEGYLVMEYMAGSTLEEMIRRRGGFAAERVTEFGIELASGLECLHEQAGMLYRDLKPANIILCQNGRIKLVDLGCACALEEKADARAGTPGFAAPEQLRGGEKLTAASDVYGLGKTLEALLGKRKCRRLRRIISACTREQVEARFPDMGSVARVLSQSGVRSRQKAGKKGCEADLIHGKIQIQKNIWKSLYKNP